MPGDPVMLHTPGFPLGVHSFLGVGCGGGPPPSEHMRLHSVPWVHLFLGVDCGGPPSEHMMRLR